MKFEVIARDEVEEMCRAQSCDWGPWTALFNYESPESGSKLEETWLEELCHHYLLSRGFFLSLAQGFPVFWKKSFSFPWNDNSHWRW